MDAEANYDAGKVCLVGLRRAVRASGPVSLLGCAHTSQPCLDRVAPLLFMSSKLNAIFDNFTRISGSM